MELKYLNKDCFNKIYICIMHLFTGNMNFSGCSDNYLFHSTLYNMKDINVFLAPISHCNKATY